ncbi:MAG TPA: ectonucleotide pyrophosphatase/phosphodiesterase [Candidatus Angelobacter sp.]|nr:ectonucleotide pyrophosphatase/phosphodiesterase [Candidatus Angelobacter sp.]
MRKILVVLLPVALFAVVLASASENNQRQSRPVIMISIDGLRPDYVFEAQRYGLKIPNLRMFVERGSYASGVHGVLPTVTYPSHTTLVTGVSPAKHGIEANTTFDPFERNLGGWYWYAEDIKVPTLWDAAAEAGITTANVHWPVTVGAHITYNLPQLWRTGTEDDRKLVRALSTPGLLASLERELGPYVDGISETIEGDENRARFAVRLLEQKKPGFMLAYFTALDHVQHETGPLSPQSFAVLERIDAIVGQLLQTAKAASSGRAVVAVVSDHGFVQTTHDVNLVTAFREAGLIQFESTQGQQEKVKSWDAEPWISGGSAAIVLKDPADAQVLSKVKTMLDKLTSDPANGIERVLDQREMHEMGGFSTAAFGISLKPGYKFGGNRSGALVTGTQVSGMHGYLPSLPEMRSVFFILGPGVVEGRQLGEIDMRDIAPTMARFLGISLKNAEGKALFPIN